jgi:glutamate-1-semialdehyde aminotransferase
MELLNMTNHKLWTKAKSIIPGGNSLLSKRPDRYAPDIWPTYFSKAKGCHIWDMDENKFVDMAQMGIGAAILGYCYDEVDNAVKEVIDSGISTTLNAPEEVYLAEKLLELNPFAGGVKFARTGGEAMTIAVRIARAFTRKDKIAFSGYHGWCDWYLAANLSGENNLSEHLLPGLSPLGVPKGLMGTAIPFRYNDIDDFNQVIKNNPDIGTIVIEGARYDFPSQEFLSAIQKTAEEKDIVIILDEITSGWRITDGGVYKINGFQSDIVVYGKGMGNGYAISAIVGKKDVMDMAQETFISSTFWTERIGFVAALKTIEILGREKVWEHLIHIGNMIGEGWLKLAEKHGLSLHVTDFKPLITMKLDYGVQNSALVTLFTQEMLKREYLASASVYVSYSHDEDVVDEYLDNVDEVFAIMAEAIERGNVMKKLETRVMQEGFQRLN